MTRVEKFIGEDDQSETVGMAPKQLESFVGRTAGAPLSSRPVIELQHGKPGGDRLSPVNGALFCSLGLKPQAITIQTGVSETLFGV